MRKDASRCTSEAGFGSKWKTKRCSRYSSNVQENTPSAIQPAMATAPCHADARYSM